VGRYRFFGISERKHAPEIVAHERESNTENGDLFFEEGATSSNTQKYSYAREKEKN